MDGTNYGWNDLHPRIPPPNAPRIGLRTRWWRRRVDPRNGMVLMALIAIATFGMILAFDAVGIRTVPPQAADRAALFILSAGQD